MTREEEIKKEAFEYADKELIGIIDFKKEEAFIEGAIWADAHPNWLSVEDYSKDKLPPLIDKNNPYGESVQVLFVVVLDGIQYLNKGTFDYDTGVWHSLDMQCSYCKENVTYWMPLPSIEHLKVKK